MEDATSKPSDVPSWLSPIPNLWETGLIHFKRILGTTLIVMIVTAIITLILPKTFRAKTTVMVLPPGYASNLEVPPQTLSMPTVQAIATSYPVLQDLLADLSIKREFARRLDERMAESETGDANLSLSEVLTGSATTASEILRIPLTNQFAQAWRGMPPSDLASGFRDFTDHDLDTLDPNEISRYLSARITTSLETNLTTRYQPILTLSSDWRTPSSSALLSYLWAHAVLRSLEDEIVQSSIRVQSEKKRQVEEVQESYRIAKSAPFEYLAYHPIDLWMAESKINSRFGDTPRNLGDQPGGTTKNDSLGESQRQLVALGEHYQRVSGERDYSLVQMGGVESLIEEYPLVLRSKLTSIPKPPKQKIAPKRAAIVLVAGFICFVLLLGYYQVQEIRLLSPGQSGA